MIRRNFISAIVGALFGAIPAVGDKAIGCVVKTVEPDQVQVYLGPSRPLTDLSVEFMHPADTFDWGSI